MAVCCGSRPPVVPARSAANLPLLSVGDGQQAADCSWAWGHAGDLAQLVCDQNPREGLRSGRFRLAPPLPLPVPLIDRRLRGDLKNDDSVWRLDAALPADPQTVLVPRRVRPGLLGA